MTDEEGKEIDGDKIMYLLAKDMKEQGKLLNNNVVATVMSNLGFLRALEQEGIGTMITQVETGMSLKKCSNMIMFWAVNKADTLSSRTITLRETVC